MKVCVCVSDVYSGMHGLVYSGLQQSKFSSPCSPESSEELKIDGSASKQGGRGMLSS